MIMIDGSIKRNCKFGLKLQSLHVILKSTIKQNLLNNSYSVQALKM